MQVTPSQLVTLLSAAIPAHKNVLITGKPGIGKTDIVSQAVAGIDWDFIVSHPVTSDPTKAEGMPWVYQTENGPRAAFIPLAELELIYAATKPTVWFIDDLGQANPSTQASFMGQFKSRFHTIVELTPAVDDFCNWTFSHNIPATLPAFIRFRPELLCDFKPTADMSNSPNPRTWVNMIGWEPLNLPHQVELAAMSGAVGDGPAAEYIAFRRMYQSLTSIDAILLDPAGCKLPTQPNELYATCTALASKATDANLSRIGIYAQRLVDASRGEFAVLLMRDCIRRTPKLQYTDAFIRISSGPLGQLISGMEN